MRLIVTAAVASLAVATDRTGQPDIGGDYNAAVKAAAGAGINAAANDNEATAMKP